MTSMVAAIVDDAFDNRVSFIGHEGYCARIHFHHNMRCKYSLLIGLPPLATVAPQRSTKPATELTSSVV